MNILLIASLGLSNCDSQLHLKFLRPAVSKMEITQQKFDALVADWEEYKAQPRIKFSSLTSKYLDGTAYCELVQLGMHGVPFVIERYKQDDDFLWGYLLEAMTGVRLMHAPDGADWLDGARERWLEWYAKSGV